MNSGTYTTKQDLIFYICGCYILVSVIANITKNIVYYNSLPASLWFCNIVAFILATGFFLKNKQAVTLVLVTAIPAQAFWIIDFFLELFGEGLGRSTRYINDPFWVVALTTNHHMIMIPFAAYGVYKLGFAKNILRYILILTITLQTFTFIFTEPKSNFNCAFYPCDITTPPADKKIDYFPFFLIKSLIFWNITGLFSYFLMYKLNEVKNHLMQEKLCIHNKLS